VSVAEAARLLGRDRTRVYALIRSGDLVTVPATEDAAGPLQVDRASLDHRLRLGLQDVGAWDQNLSTEWHVRYRGPGVMIYWHVDKKACCVYSQLQSCSSSEVAAMIEGVLRHCTEMSVDRNYVDSHGQSPVAFAFTNLLGFELLRRVKAIHAQSRAGRGPPKPAADHGPVPSTGR
jgi:hypothetical protein